MPRKLVPEFDLRPFLVPFRSESDRACAVLGAALLDARLERLFQRRLHCCKTKFFLQVGVHLARFLQECDLLVLSHGLVKPCISI